MAMRLFIPLRFKILVLLLVGITTVVSIITFMMANLFHADKSTYIHDLISVGADQIASETDSLLENYAERIKLFARVAYDERITKEEKIGMLMNLFTDFPEVVSVSFHEKDAETTTVFDDQILKTFGLSKADLDDYRKDHPLPGGILETEGTYIRNSTFSEDLPLLTVATGFSLTGGEQPILLEALVRMNRLIAILGRSAMFESFLLDQDGNLLAHGNLQRVSSHLPVEGIPEEVWRSGRSNIGQTFEYASDGIDMIGWFTRVETGNLIAGVQKPKAAAFLSARDLFNKLLWVSLGLLLSTAVIGLIWSHRMARPLEQLSNATQEVAKGEFDIQVKTTSRDEIGNLAHSFNKMASELRDREKALRDAQAALVQSEKMSAFGQLSAGIAHEVKNPLAGILGYTQLSLKKVEKDTPVFSNLKTIEKETKRCNSIIGNLMKFARQEQAEFSPTEINQVVEDAIGIVAHQLGVNQVRIEKDLTEDLPDVMGNANQLQQVLMNIMINAQQAMDGQPGTVRAATRLPEEGTLEIRISDTGPGLPEEIQKRIFEPFFTTKPAGKGTGLGLSVTYGIIKDHGGSIRVESPPGEGATFIVTLPAIERDVPEEKPTETA